MIKIRTIYIIISLLIVVSLVINCKREISLPPPQGSNNSHVYPPDYLKEEPPGTTVKLFANEIFSQYEHLHSCPVFSPDGKKMFWTIISSNYKLWFMKEVNQLWFPPTRARFMHDGNADSPIMSPDGNRIFFLSVEPTGFDKARPENIWYVERTENGWSEEILVGQEVNSYLVHWQVSIANNGNLYFSGSETNPDDKDIIMAQLVDGVYTNVMDLGDSVNTTSTESTPFIDPNEQYLIFSKV